MDRTNVIGEKVKSLRTAKEISLEELADRTGLAVEQITRIEENIDIPSLAPLVKLARALGVRLGTFLDDQPDEAGPVVCRRGDADDTISFSNNALDARQHLHYHSLSAARPTDTWNRLSSTSMQTEIMNSICLLTREKSLSWY